MDPLKSDFKKFLKYFSTRLVQTLVQARLGDDIESQCMSSTHTHDWFNLKIDENGETSAYMKAAIKNYPPNGKVIVEFLLYTSSGQMLPVEAWVLSTDERIDNHVEVRSELYHQMSTLLRSSAVAARMTPLHRLYVKKQNPESFIILYRVFENYSPSDMGENGKTRRIGEFSSPFGYVCLDLHYRTSMHFDHPEVASDKSTTKDSSNENEHGIKKPSECVPIGSHGKKEKSTPMSATMCNFQASSQNTASPRFKLGQSTSSEESRNSEQHISMDDSNKPLLADLRNHSLPFLNLLHSAYNAPVKRRIEDSESSKVETVSNKSPTHETEIEMQSLDEKNDNSPEMSDSDESFVDFLPIGEHGNKLANGNDLGILLQQLKLAPEILKSCDYYQNNIDLQAELKKLDEQKKDLDCFINHINKITED